MRRPWLVATLGCAAAALAVHAAHAQEDTFQIVSVRKVGRWTTPPSGIAQTPSMTVLPGGRFEARGQSLEELARVAYGFDHNDVQRGVVDGNYIYWASTDRFDITAAADGAWTAPPAGESTPIELRKMLRTLLEDRFQLVTRIETRKMDAYAVRRATRNGEPGPWLRPSAGDCLGPYTRRPPGATDDTPKCTLRLDRSIVEAGGVSMADVTRIISRISGIGGGLYGGSNDRPIVDQTGFEGVYDMLLAIGVGKPLPNERAEVDKRVFVAERTMVSGRRSLAIGEALELQLGLKLERTTLPVPVLVLRRAKQPTED